MRRLSPAAETRLTNNNDGDHDANWSGSGARLFITSEHGNIKQPYGDIYRLDSMTGEVISPDDEQAPVARRSERLDDSKVIAAMEPLLPVSRGPHVIDVSTSTATTSATLAGRGWSTSIPTSACSPTRDGDGTPDYLESGSVGEPEGRRAGAVGAGKPFTVTFAWKHPEAWRGMDAMELFLTGRHGPIGAVRLLIGSRQALGLGQHAPAAMDSRGGREETASCGRAACASS